MINKSHVTFKSLLVKTFIAGLISLSACSPAVSTISETNAATTSAPAAEAVATAPQEAPVNESTDPTSKVSLNTGNLASSLQIETVPAVVGNDAPFWQLLPEHTRITLPGYPISNHQMAPVISIFPVEELQKINEGTQPVVASLQTLLASPQEIPNLPFLPLVNTSQVMHTHLQYLDFKNGQGLRYLTMFAQGIMPINNSELVYTYQGLTRDGKYYVSAVLPVTHPSLPADASITGNEPPEFNSDFSAYVQNTASALNAQAANTFTPDLAQLDAMLSSLEINQ